MCVCVCRCVSHPFITVPYLSVQPFFFPPPPSAGFYCVEFSQRSAADFSPARILFHGLVLNPHRMCDLTSGSRFPNVAHPKDYVPLQRRLRTEKKKVQMTPQSSDISHGGTRFFGDLQGEKKKESLFEIIRRVYRKGHMMEIFHLPWNLESGCRNDTLTGYFSFSLCLSPLIHPSVNPSILVR